MEEINLDAIHRKKWIDRVKKTIDNKQKCFYLFNRLSLFIKVISILPPEYAHAVIRQYLSPEHIHDIVNSENILFFIKNMPSEYAEPIYHYVFNHPMLFISIWKNHQVICDSILNLPEQYVEEFIQHNAFHGEKTLTKLLQWIVDYGSSFSLRGAETSVFLVENGANGNIILLHEQKTLLQALINSHFNSEAMALIDLGANIHTINKRNSMNAMDYSMATIPFSHSRIELVLLLIQYGADLTTLHTSFSLKLTRIQKNILQIIYDEYPQIREYIQEQGVPKNKLEQPSYVFKKIDICSLRLAVKYQSSIHQRRNELLNFLIILAQDRNNPVSISFFSKLPMDIILNILSFFDYKKMNKSWEQEKALLNEILLKFSNIKLMLQSPGGVNVYENKNGQFIFFKSATLLCVDFDRLKNKLRQQERMTRWDFVEKLEWLRPMPAALSKFKENYASLTLMQNMSFFKRKRDKMALTNSIRHHPLYKGYF